MLIYISMYLLHAHTCVCVFIKLWLVILFLTNRFIASSFETGFPNCGFPLNLSSLLFSYVVHEHSTHKNIQTLYHTGEATAMSWKGRTNYFLTTWLWAWPLWPWISSKQGELTHPKRWQFGEDEEIIKCLIDSMLPSTSLLWNSKGVELGLTEEVWEFFCAS